MLHFFGGTNGTLNNENNVSNSFGKTGYFYQSIRVTKYTKIIEELDLYFRYVKSIAFRFFGICFILQITKIRLGNRIKYEYLTSTKPGV